MTNELLLFYGSKGINFGKCVNNRHKKLCVATWASVRVCGCVRVCMCVCVAFVLLPFNHINLSKTMSDCPSVSVPILYLTFICIALRPHLAKTYWRLLCEICLSPSKFSEKCFFISQWQTVQLFFHWKFHISLCPNILKINLLSNFWLIRMLHLTLVASAAMILVCIMFS